MVSIKVYGMQQTLITYMRKLVTSVNTLPTPYIHLLPISKMPNLETLTDSQRDELTQQYVEIVVDSMDLDTLVQYAKEQLIAYHNEDSIECLKEDIDNYDEELFDELVDNVTQQYPKQLNEFGN